MSHFLQTCKCYKIPLWKKQLNEIWKIWHQSVCKSVKDTFKKWISKIQKFQKSETTRKKIRNEELLSGPNKWINMSHFLQTCKCYRIPLWKKQLHEIWKIWSQSVCKSWKIYLRNELKKFKISKIRNNKGKNAKWRITKSESKTRTEEEVKKE